MVTWTDEAGHQHVSKQWTKSPASLGAIPKQSRLVNVHDPADHHIASLVRNGAASPLLYIRATWGPVPVAALEPAGLLSVMTSRDDNGWTVHLFGTPPQQQIEVRCSDCGRALPLAAAALRAAMPTGPTSRTPIVRVGT
jgi:hypothetical protein